MTAFAVLGSAVIAVVAPAPAPAMADAAGVGGNFVPFATPRSILDTRSGTGGVTGARGPASTTTFTALGVNSIPATGVSSLLVRVQSSGPTATTYLTVFPDGTPRPGISNLNVQAGINVSNTAVVKPGANGKLAVYNSAGNTGIVIDVQGYFTSSSASGGGLVPVTQSRIVDTRSGVGTTTGTIAAKASRTINLAAGGIPVGAAAAYVSVMVTGATVAGWLAAAPAGTATGGGVLAYEEGTTTTGASLKLAANGQVVFVNQGTAAIHLVIDTYAYASATPTAGAGLRPMTATRVFDSRTAAAVPAGGTVDVVVGGTNGLPTRGVAAAALDIESSGTASGNLKIWPVGATEPASTFGHRAANVTRSSLALVRPGTDGKIRIRNSSDQAATVIVDLMGWFGDPIPAAPVVPFTPTSALQAPPASTTSLGTMAYAYTDNLGRVVQGHQTDVDNFGSVQWTVVSGNEAFSGQPALSTLSTGATQLSAQYGDSDIWTIAGSTWTDVGGSMAAPPAAIRLSTGVTNLFATDVDGKLWVYAQTGTVPFWRNLGDQDLVGTPVVVGIRNGVQVFARHTSGAIRTAQFVDGALSAWTDLGGAGSTGAPSVVIYPGYLLRLFVRAADGTIATKMQSGTAFPAAWTTLGTYVSGGAPAAILDPVDGRTAVVTRDPNGAIHLAWETAQASGTFGDWTPAIDIFDPAATDPTVAPLTNSNGQSWIIVFRNTNNASRVYVRQPAPALAARATTSGPFTSHTLPAPPA